MILHSDATTPFGRKCLVAAFERGVPLEERFVDLANPGDYLAVNPLNQIPALTTPDGDHLFDSVHCRIHARTSLRFYNLHDPLISIEICCRMNLSD